jgi:uncharacterized membrane protein YGL010W
VNVYMNTVTQLLEEYSKSHQHRFNKIIHWICVPVIVFSLLGMLWLIPFPQLQYSFLIINWCTLFLFFGLFYYFYLSWRLAIGMLVYIIMMCLLLFWLSNTLDNLLTLFISLFVSAWIGQFIGHHIEKKRPSFFRDIQFLLIGPLWLLSAIYRRLKISY